MTDDAPRSHCATCGAPYALRTPCRGCAFVPGTCHCPASRAKFTAFRRAGYVCRRCRQATRNHVPND